METKVNPAPRKAPCFSTGSGVNKTKIYLLSIFAAFMGIILAKIFFDFVSKDPDKISALEKPTGVPSKPQKETLIANTITNLSKETKKTQRTPLVLNGIVFSSETRYALINNRIVKEGAKIEGATVTKITKDWVELKTADQETFNLSCD